MAWLGLLFAGVDVDAPAGRGEKSLLDRFEHGEFGSGVCDPDDPVESFLVTFPSLEIFRREPILKPVRTQARYSNDPGRAAVGVRIGEFDMLSEGPKPEMTPREVSEAVHEAGEALRRAGCYAPVRLWLVFQSTETMS